MESKQRELVHFLDLKLVAQTGNFTGLKLQDYINVCPIATATAPATAEELEINCHFCPLNLLNKI